MSLSSKYILRLLTRLLYFISMHRLCAVSCSRPPPFSCPPTRMRGSDSHPSALTLCPFSITSTHSRRALKVVKLIKTYISLVSLHKHDKQDAVISARLYEYKQEQTAMGYALFVYTVTRMKGIATCFMKHTDAPALHSPNSDAYLWPNDSGLCNNS